MSDSRLDKLYMEELLEQIFEGPKDLFIPEQAAKVPNVY